MEHVDSLHLLARSDKLDGLGHYRTDGESGTATGITVQLRKHDSVKIETVVEFLGCVDGILTRHGVDDEERVVRMYGLLQRSDLIHHLLVDGQTAGGIDDHHIVTLGFCFLYGVKGDLVDVLLTLFRIDRYADLLTDYPQLLDSGRGWQDDRRHRPQVRDSYAAWS